eukprot:4758665-Lingulodinium_polyedra.AAC.1
MDAPEKFQARLRTPGFLKFLESRVLSQEEEFSSLPAGEPLSESASSAKAGGVEEEGFAKPEPGGTSPME